MSENSKPTMTKARKNIQLNCMHITNLILPAVRASVAEKLSGMGYGQETIAEELGIAQAAVSKYMNGRYSEEVRIIKKHIDERQLSSGIIDDITQKKSKASLENDINSLCERLVDYYNS